MAYEKCIQFVECGSAASLEGGATVTIQYGNGKYPVGKSCDFTIVVSLHFKNPKKSYNLKPKNGCNL